MNIFLKTEDEIELMRQANLLVGRTLREVTCLTEVEDTRRRRGVFGNVLEEHYFKIRPNSRAEADFAEAGLELKSTPLRRNKRGELVAKERLVLSMINYGTVVDEDFEHSHLMEKARDILLVSYLFEEDRSPLDYEIQAVVRWGFSLPAAMGVYWAIGALISMLQTAITQYFMGKKMAKQKKGI